MALVFFDLETTGLGRSCEIVQLAAVSGHHALNLYVVPRCRIEPNASKITGFTVKQNRLFLHGKPVSTISLREVLMRFIDFIRMLCRPLLMGHNIKRFDCPVLARALDEFHLRDEFQSVVGGFVDTLPLARQLLKDNGLKSFSQENLVKEALGTSYAAHNALEDVKALQKLYSALKPTANEIRRHIFTMDIIGIPLQKVRPAKKEPTKFLDEQIFPEHFSKPVNVNCHSGSSASGLLESTLGQLLVFLNVLYE
ncbi:three prime repair exonuclease 4 [Chanos chanos]|uniref:exodeoxyribonuclease III n=1 Tax=Chanos chanos TaxID=29144 RepID=A0A6J2VD70_CHACN|nr:maternal protein exuperantia-1-like [Chanos chanos]